MMKKLGKKLMKKPAAAMKKMKTKTKKRSACIKRPAMTSAAVKQRRWRENVRMKKEQVTKNNVLHQARQAARNGLPYQTKLRKLDGVAAAAYAAAETACRAADEAKEDAADARAMAIENNKLITCLAGEVAETSTQARTSENRLTRVEQRLNSQMTPEQRMGYMTGYMTPGQRM